MAFLTDTFLTASQRLLRILSSANPEVLWWSQRLGSSTAVVAAALFISELMIILFFEDRVMNAWIRQRQQVGIQWHE